MARIGIRVDIDSVHTQVNQLVRTTSLAIELSKLYFDVYFFTKSELCRNFVEQQGFNVFTMPIPASQKRTYLKVQNKDETEVSHVLPLFEKHGIENLILDIKDATPELYRAYRPHLKRIMHIEDTFRFKTFSNLIINGTIGAAEIEYPEVPRQIVLSGPSYALIDYALTDYESKRMRKFVKTIFLYTRRGDVHRSTVRFLQTFLMDSQLKNMKYQVFVSQDAPVDGELLKLSSQHSNISLFYDPDRLLPVISESDIAITNDTFMIYRLLRVGVPTVSFILPEDYNDIQDYVHQRFTDIDRSLEQIWEYKYIGMVLDEENYDQMLLRKVLKLVDSYSMRSTLAERGKKLIDGKGAIRVANYIRKWIRS